MKTLLLISLPLALALPAPAQEEKSTAQPAQVTQGGETASGEKTPPATQPAEAKDQPEPKAGADKPSGDAAADKAPAFVDRDGDGIQDGKEHRFRGKHRREGKGLSGEEGEGSKIRHRQRNGRR